MQRYEYFRLGFIRFSALIAYILVFFSIVYTGMQVRAYLDERDSPTQIEAPTIQPNMCRF